MAMSSSFSAMLSVAALFLGAVSANAAEVQQVGQFEENALNKVFVESCPDTFIGDDVRAGSQVRILCGAQIGDGVILGNDVEVGPEVVIGVDSIILSGVKLIDSTVGPRAVVGCSDDGTPCTVTLDKCTVDPDVEVVESGYIEGRTYSAASVQVRGRRAVDQSNCKGTKDDTSACCRSTAGKITVYKNCMDTTTKKYVPVVSHQKACAATSCQGSNVNIARKSQTTCATGLSNAGFSIGLQNTLAPTSNFNVNSHQCSSKARKRRQVYDSEADVVVVPEQVYAATQLPYAGQVSMGVVGYTFEPAAVAELRADVQKPTSDTYLFLADQETYWVEIEGQVYPIMNRLVVVSVVLPHATAGLFVYNTWATAFEAKNPTCKLVHYFQQTLCNRIFSFECYTGVTKEENRVKVDINQIGKADMVLYTNATQIDGVDQTYTSCKRTDMTTLSLPFAQDSFNMTCVHEGDNRLPTACI